MSAAEAVEHVFSRKESAKSHRNARIGLADGRIAGGIMMYRADDPRVHWSDPIVPKERHAVLRPFDELQAEGLYVDFVAVYPDFCGQGIGRRLLGCARAEAIEQGLPLLSLHVFEQNEGATRLYRRLGFEITKRRPVVPHTRIIYGGNMALMTCQL
jgi:ribosomal protein S18 acetylase RimI-like enzyme